MWQLSGSPRIYLDVFPITSWHRHLACHCLGTGETSWIQRGGHEAMSRSWDSIIEPETESWHHYLLTRQEQEVKHHGCCSGDKWSVSELCSVWWPVVTMGPMSHWPGLLISIGSRSPQILLYSHFTYLKTPNTDEVWYFFTIKTSGQKHILCVLC